MESSRPKDNIRLLLQVWLHELEASAKARTLKLAQEMKMPEFFNVTQYDIDMNLVRRVRAFLEEHPR